MFRMHLSSDIRIDVSQTYPLSCKAWDRFDSILGEVFLKSEEHCRRLLNLNLNLNINKHVFPSMRFKFQSSSKAKSKVLASGIEKKFVSVHIPVTCINHAKKNWNEEYALYKKN